jgi:hypothetical protein
MNSDIDLATRRDQIVTATEEAKLTWLRGAANEAFASLDRGEGISFDYRDELDAYIMEISEEVFASV